MKSSRQRFRRWLERAHRRFDDGLLRLRMTPQRRFLNQVLLPRWAGQFHSGQLVYDIGKSRAWDYSHLFHCQYTTIDRDPAAGVSLDALCPAVQVCDVIDRGR